MNMARAATELTGPGVIGSSAVQSQAVLESTQQREDTIDSIEKTLYDISSLFKRFSTIV